MIASNMFREDQLLQSNTKEGFTMNETNFNNETTPIMTMINSWSNDNTPDIDLYTKNKEFFDKFYDRISNFAEMDFDVELKSLKNKKEELRHAHFNTNTQIQLSENIIKTNMMFNGNMSEELPNSTSTYMEMLETSPDEYMFAEQMRNLKDEISVDMEKLDLCIRICETLKNEKYDELNDSTEISRLIEKLKNDIKMLEHSSDLNKDKTISNIKEAIELIMVMDGKFLIDTMHTDKRAYKLAKEMMKNGHKPIEKVFGKDILDNFTTRMNSRSLEKAYDTRYPEWACKLFLYHITKKIMTSMKVKDYKSLVYKSYMIHFLVDTEPFTPESDKMETIFGNIIQRYENNRQITNFIYLS